MADADEPRRRRQRLRPSPRRRRRRCRSRRTTSPNVRARSTTSPTRCADRRRGPTSSMPSSARSTTPTSTCPPARRARSVQGHRAAPAGRLRQLPQAVRRRSQLAEADRATGRLAEALLPVLDACEAAFVRHPDEVGPLLNQMLVELKKHGLETLDLAGQAVRSRVRRGGCPRAGRRRRADRVRGAAQRLHLEGQGPARRHGQDEGLSAARGQTPAATGRR